MKILFTTLLFLSTLAAFSSAAFAQETNTECTDSAENLGAFRFHRYANAAGKCYMSATPIKVQPDYVYRSFLFTNTGSLMVFNSINYDEYGVSDGARMFTFFPRNQTPEYIDRGDFVAVKTSTAGLEVNFDKELKKIHSVVGANFKEDPKVTPNNAGGFELLNAQFLYLDSGYAVGEDPTGQPNRQAKFVDSNGKTCSVKVGEVFSYKGDNPYVKYSDAELKTWLKTRCPQLTVNF